MAARYHALYDLESSSEGSALYPFDEERSSSAEDTDTCYHLFPDAPSPFDEIRNLSRPLLRRVIDQWWKGDPVLSRISEFETLAPGWDGEDASAPNKSSIRDALLFVWYFQETGFQMDATLHVDGSVILDLERTHMISLEFRGEGKISFASTSGVGGIVNFNGRQIPNLLNRVLTE